MNIVFVSLYYNHHLSSLSNSLFKLTGGHYYFVQTRPMTKGRIELGWGNTCTDSFVRQSYLDDKSYSECVKLIDDADVVIIGSAPMSFVGKRLKHNKLTFKYSESMFKGRHFDIIRRIKFFLLNFPYRNTTYYYLLSSAYAKQDFISLGINYEKMYKWGYFPETKKYDDIDSLIEKKRPNSLLWTARLIDWKHPEIPVEIAKRLKEDGYGFTLDMIGVGPLENKVKDLISKYGLEDKVRLLGSMSPDKVREKMEESEVFLFTSDRNEGWGAVLNESMNSCCAVIANKAIGSVPYLIEDGENGLTYSGKNIDRIYAQVKRLLDDKELKKQLGKKAYETIVTEWNAEVAAERFIKLIESGKYKNNEMFRSGPCSRA